MVLVSYYLGNWSPRVFRGKTSRSLGLFSGLGKEKVKIGALIVRIGFCCTLYDQYYKEPQNSVGNHLGLHINGFRNGAFAALTP